MHGVNESLKGNWFTPDGRIYKNESWQEALLSISKLELDYTNWFEKIVYLDLANRGFKK